MRRLAFVALAGCSQLLGLSPPKDKGDDAPDAPEPVPGTVRVIMGGTGAQGVVTSNPAGINCPGTCEMMFPVGTTVTLSATTTGTSEFTGFFRGGCSGASTCEITPTGPVDVYARYFTSENIWFTSSTVHHPGAFDGIAAADAECDLLAAQAGLPARDYIAWLPTSTKSALTRMLDQVVVGANANLWRRPDGQVFAVTAQDLQFGRVRFPARLDELGRDVGDDAVVVTDTLASGATSGGSHCSDWASESAPAVVAGEAAGGTGRFTDVAPLGCDRDAHLYCLSAVENSALPIAPLSESIVFVSFGTIAGTAGVAAMDALCATEATQANLPHFTTRALVTPGGGKPVKDHFIGIAFSSDPVMRPDGVAIARSMDDLFAGAAFAAAPNVAADREYRNDEVWVGGGSFASFDLDCNGWTGGAFGTTRFAATTRGATFTQQKSCTDSAHVLCFNGQVAMAKPAP